MSAPKRVAAINDLSGFGRCSLTVAIPVISAMGVQVCPLPTAVLCAHTGYPVFTFADFTAHMREYAAGWDRLGVRFDAVYSGFLGSTEQIDIVLDFCRSHPDALHIVDPVMGDDGAIYKTYTPQMCARMRTLCEAADCITPNLTEACILLGETYSHDLTEERMRAYAEALSKLGPRYVVITGIRQDDCIVNAIYADGAFAVDRHLRLNAYCSGTGDIFSSVITGSLLTGHSFLNAVKRAGQFVSDVIVRTAELGETCENGVIFEPLLGDLARDNAVDPT